MKVGETRVEASALSFALQYRKDLTDDQGLNIQVIAYIDGSEVELLRFDCFDQNPHYHYGPENKNERLFLDKTTAGNPIGWTIKQLRTRLPEMVRRAGYGAVSDEIQKPKNAALIRKKLDTVETLAREIAATERRTVVHNRGDKVIQAGNIKFGLEFRELKAIDDRGLAIHVLADVAGQEIELLAFDCFERDPHYHYGPRNKDVRIFWDTTLVPDTLRWTLDQFRDGKLPDMIERAGYPGVVAELDKDLIISAVEKELEPAALVLSAANAR